MRTRITIQTSEKLDKALEEICKRTGRSSKSEVIRDSIELYALIVQRFIDNDAHLFLGVTPETAAEVLLPHLERAASREPRPQLSAVPSPTPSGAGGKEGLEMSSVRRRKVSGSTRDLAE